MADLNDIGLAIVLWFQAWRSAPIAAIYSGLHFMGSADFYLLILPFVYWCVDANFGRKLSLSFLAGMWGNGMLKEWWRTPRPADLSAEVRPSVVETTYAMPSGHAQGTVLLWGTLAYHLRRQWLTLAVIVFTLLMMVSRVGAGVHFPQDVIGGALIGLIWLGGYVWLEPRLGGWLDRQSLWMQMGVAVVIGGLLLAIHPILIPASNAEALANAVTPPAAIIGAGIGFSLEVRYVRFDAGGVWWKRALRFLLGALVVGAIRYGLGAAFEGLEPEGVYRLIRYVLMGFMLSAGMPWLYVKMGLAGQRIS